MTWSKEEITGHVDVTTESEILRIENAINQDINAKIIMKTLLKPVI